MNFGYIFELPYRMWPEKEALLSQLTRKIASRGLPLDGPLCQKQIDALDDAMIEAGKILPWNGAAPITSPNALKDACRIAGVDSPPSSNEDDPKLLLWKQKHPEQAVWPDARVEAWTDVSVDEWTTLREGTGRPLQP